MKKTLLVLILVLTGLVQAETLTVSFGFRTDHIGNSSFNYNEDNQFFALSYGKEQGVHAATLVNSYYTRTYAVGVHHRYTHDSGLFVTGRTGLIVGYTYDNFKALGRFNPCTFEPICIYVAGGVGYQFDRLSYEVLFFGNAVTQNFSFDFDLSK